MPPRIPSSMCLRALRGEFGTFKPIEAIYSDLLAALPEFEPLSSRKFSNKASYQASAGLQRRRHRDPYAVAQARARKAANISRQEVLQQERANALGDPVRGITTTFIQSFDTAGANLDSEKKPHLKHFLAQDEVDEQVQVSKELSTPATPSEATPEKLGEIGQRHEKLHNHAIDAVRRIIDMQNSCAEDRIKANVQRCIETFGRHNTDKFLPPKPKAMPTPPRNSSNHATPSLSMEEQAALDKQPLGDVVKRAGPDTGSSEVQIAILTAKIRSLADFLETRGKKDKVGKRDLRLLVHRRAKLLKYLRRKERGGPRWQRCIEMLGLTEGTWKGEISL